MPANEYAFVTYWRVRGTRERVADVIDDAEDLPRWWPEVYLDVKVTAPGDARGVGKRADLYTRGWLPYTLRWTLEITEVNRPHGFALRAEGDLEGSGRWRFTQAGPWVDIRYDWRVRADKPLLRWCSPALKPVFSWNHRWAMATGERALARELARLRGTR